ncbi:MAG: sugar kinase [Chloroflexi bacterium]|nr:sugar kinase [Chloroflexota bacterium]
MAIMVVGSVALDTVETPRGRRTGALGGACTYFSTAASLFSRVRMVGVVGTDFPEEYIGFLQGRDIDLEGLQVEEGKTFAWSGRYGEDMGDAETLSTELNLFAEFHPVVPESYRTSPYVFLANIDPQLQLEVLAQVEHPRLTALDSMNYWIDSQRDALTKAMSRVNLVVLNETEVQMYSGEQNLVSAADAILSLGPWAVVIKRGGEGSMLVTRGESLGQRVFVTPAYLLPSITDPTGAGDTFAGGMMGYLAETGDLSVRGLRQALVYGTIVASHTVQGFSVDALCNLTRQDLVQRYNDHRRMTLYDTTSAPDTDWFDRSIV